MRKTTPKDIPSDSYYDFVAEAVAPIQKPRGIENPLGVRAVIASGPHQGKRVVSELEAGTKLARGDAFSARLITEAFTLVKGKEVPVDDLTDPTVNIHVRYALKDFGPPTSPPEVKLKDRAAKFHRR